MQLVRHHAALLQAAGFVDKTTQHGLGLAAIAEGADVLTFAGTEVPEPGQAKKAVGAFVTAHADIGQAGIVGAGYLWAGTGAGVLHGRSLD